MICPKCKADLAHRSHRRGLIEFGAGFFAIRPYRCHGCQHRFLRFRYATEEAPGTASVDREVQATRSAMQLKRKRRELLLYGVGILLFLVFLYFITRERGTPSDGG